ncbi:MAG TPA: hypothetical protein VFP26_08345 [Gemmatimonadaceae bacterium]|jgi:hypothetical protein|nr:hypothetical protein [Gemmatimonadaceae bacterium]
MSGRRWLWVLVLVAAGGTVACSDATAPTQPLSKKASLTKPTGASFGRYILISGVVTCVEDCDSDGGPGQRADGGPLTGSDSLPGIQIPPDSSAPFGSSGGN